MSGPQFNLTANLGATAAVKSTLNLPLLQSRFFVEDCARGWLYLVATFEDPTDPLVHGFGVTEEQAWRVARATNKMRTTKGQKPQTAVLCSRIAGTDELVWRSKAGQTVTIEHLQTKREH